MSPAFKFFPDSLHRGVWDSPCKMEGEPRQILSFPSLTLRAKYELWRENSSKES